MKAAVSRLDFAPETDEMEVVDIRTGRFVFVPRAGRAISYARLDKAITDAGYEIESARLTVTGELTAGSYLRVPESGQTFRLTGDPGPGRPLAELESFREERGPGATLTVSGAWSTTDEDEVVLLESWEPTPDPGSAR